MYRRGTSLERCMLGRNGDRLMTVSSGSREGVETDLAETHPALCSTGVCGDSRRASSESTTKSVIRRCMYPTNERIELVLSLVVVVQAGGSSWSLVAKLSVISDMFFWKMEISSSWKRLRRDSHQIDSGNSHVHPKIVFSQPKH